MEEEIHQLLDAAISKETASQALYAQLQNKTDDPGARQLMKELEADEKSHARWIAKLRDSSDPTSWTKKPVSDLGISEQLNAPSVLEGAGLQDTLIFAMRREQSSVEFYSRMMAVTRAESGKKLCLRLVNQEMSHKLKLELLYDNLFLGED
jgi:rubrerythrin